MVLDPEVILKDLHGLLDDAGLVSMSSMDAAEQARWVCELHSVRERVDAVTVVSTASADQALVPARLGHTSMADLVSTLTPADPRVARGDAALGRWLLGYPDFADAWTQGRITRSHVKALKTLENPRLRLPMRNNQEMLVESAVACGWDRWHKALNYFDITNDPDGQRPREQRTNRSCTSSKNADGTVGGSFQFDKIAGFLFRTALEHQYQRLFRQDSENGRVESRTPTQRRADALINLVARGAQRANASLAAPLVHVIMGLNIAADALARSKGDSHTQAGDPVDPRRQPVDVDDVDGRCELADGTPIHPTEATGVAAYAVLRRIIMSADSEIVDLGTAVRSFPPQLKQALLVAARGRCQHRSGRCDAPYAWLQADHIQPHSRGGPTNLTNGQILCSPDNKRKHDKPPDP